MILFDLKCGKNHVFEAWFRDGDSADLQIAAGKIACPTCGNGKVAKAPMAPRIGKGSEPRAAEKQVENSEIAAKSAKAGNALRELRAKIEADFDAIDKAPGEYLVTSLAMACPFGASEKQALLEAADLDTRAELLTALVEMAAIEPTSEDTGGTRH